MTDLDARPGTPVCVIGGSAGGLESIRSFLEACAADLGYAYVVVMHLDPKQPSELESIFARASALPVATASDGQLLRPDRVYVCPPAMQPRIANDRLRLSPPQDGGHASFDELLFSMTERRARDAVAIFSGATADGLLGVQAFREHGLDVFAQTPADAGFARMPQAIIDRGLADVVGTPAEIAARLADVRRSVDAGLAEVVDDERALEQLLETTHAQTGLDFRPYKRSMIRRRVLRRIYHVRVADLGAYIRWVADDRDEAWRLAREFLIPVTRFFRDPEAFEALGEQVRARLVERDLRGSEFRVWVAGCASGEEAYSVAITVLEAIEETGSQEQLSLFATDVDDRAVTLARSGTYDEHALQPVSADVLTKWFKPADGDFQVRRALRDRVIIAPHNLLADPPFMNLDLVVCRNVFIYLEPATQARIARAFRCGLREGGLLMLSPAETVPHEGGDFVTIDQHHAIFAANGAAPVSGKVPTREAAPAQRPARAEGAREEPAAQPADAMHGRPHPMPQVVVDAEYRLQHLYGDVGRYLKIPDGAPTGNLLRLVRPELQAVLRYALASCFRSGAPAHDGPVTLGKQEEPQVTLVHASPELGTDGRVERALVTFFASTPHGHDGETGDGDAFGDASTLTQENRNLRRRLSSAVEDYAALAERLTEKKQELQSLNEEYRSSTEELRASQEELQSLNEELKTVNEELRRKYDETRVAHAHLNAVISATEFGTVFVERDRTIRMMTPKISEVFNLEPRDVGRKLTSFTHALEDCDPLALLSEAEGADTPVERTVRHRDGRWFLLRARTFHDDEPGEDGMDGLVLSVVDVTRLQEAERAVRARDERLRHILHSAKLVAARYEHADDALTLAGAIPAVFWEDMPAQMDAESFLARVEPQSREEVRKSLFTGEGAGRVELEFRASIDGREPRLIAATGERIDQGAGAEVLLTFRNVSAFKRVEAENAAKSRFLAQMSHELRTPLNAISGMADTLRSVDALGEDKAKRDEYLDDILFSASHLTDLVSDLLDIARLENDAAANMADFDVQATLESVLKIMQPLAEDKGIDLHFQSDAPATTLHAHERGFRQVLVNLINNAIKYCPSGTEVTLDFTVQADGTKAVVSVIDEGPGIPDKLLDRIGTAFIHVDNPDVRLPHPTKEPGLGIGLSIVDQILRGHNGEMRVHSVPGRGTKMKTIWPRARTDDLGRAWESSE